jgi:hypothetical protein
MTTGKKNSGSGAIFSALYSKIVTPEKVTAVSFPVAEPVQQVEKTEPVVPKGKVAAARHAAAVSGDFAKLRRRQWPAGMAEVVLDDFSTCYASEETQGEYRFVQEVKGWKLERIRLRRGNLVYRLERGKQAGIFYVGKGSEIKFGPVDERAFVPMAVLTEALQAVHDDLAKFGA